MLQLFVRIGLAALTAISVVSSTHAQKLPLLDPGSQQILITPEAERSAPAAGKRVFVTPQSFQGSGVFHTLYLPPDWQPTGPKLPIIFEYTGNYFPASGSTGEPEDAGLGYGLSGGKFIWVSLPYVSEDHRDNEKTWWGDLDATVEYAKQQVPLIIAEFNADPNNVFLCGFSRGAIGVNFIGLHDDKIASLWTAFVSHDHFDGAKRWGTEWGSPLEKYQKQARERLERVAHRPYLVSQHGSIKASENFVRSSATETSNFVFSTIDARRALGSFPNEFAKAAHTDRWLSKPSSYRTRTWQWINRVVRQGRSSRVNQ